MKKNLIILAIIILVAAGLYVVKTKIINNNLGGAIACTMEAKICPDGSAVGRSGPKCEFAPCPGLSDKKIISAAYNCTGSKNIKALFYEDKADLTLSDGRKLLLLHAISASGARYTNSDESFVFWNKGDTAFVEEKNKMTFQNCLATDNENQPVVSCTKEAKICPDGSAVGRSGPKCEFAPCPEKSVSQIANPASVNCQKVGGRLVIEKRGDGGEYGLCYFDDNRACEEWSMLKGDCAIGGVKTTGYDTLDQKYCAWSGGQTLAVPNSICTFKNGSKCSTLDFYNGRCLPSN